MKTSRLLSSLVFAVAAAAGVALFAAEQHLGALQEVLRAKCHGETAAARRPAESLSARNFTDAEWQAGEKDTELIQAVQEGKDDMPPFGKKLTQEQIESLVKNDVRGFAKK
jgi:mono/diheme cytochrome c family protein